MTLLDDYNDMHNNVSSFQNKVYAAMAKEALTRLAAVTGDLDTDAKKREIRTVRDILRGEARNAKAAAVALVSSGMDPATVTDANIQSTVTSRFDKLAYLFDANLDLTT